jgi:hypothetical protein
LFFACLKTTPVLIAARYTNLVPSGFVGHCAVAMFSE